MKKINKFFLTVLIFIITQSYIFCITENLKKSTKKNILKSGKVWQKNYNLYVPDAKLLPTLKDKIGKDLKIDVYLGLWCSDSENNVPVFIKISDNLKNIKEINYYLCKRKKDKKTEFFVKDKQIKRVPTFIFYRNNKEIGRIIENPKKTLLEDFLEIVF